MTMRLQPRAAEFNDLHVCTSCLLSGPDTKCSICQANVVVYACRCVYTLHVCVMVLSQFRSVGVRMPAYAKHSGNAFPSAYTVLIYSIHVCVHTV